MQSARVGQIDCENELKNYLAKKGEKPFVGLIHRLDQPVEGVLVVAKTKDAAAELNKQLMRKTLNKTYLAVAYTKEAIQKTQTGDFTDYIIKDDQVAKIVCADTPNAKLAKLKYELIRECDGLSLLKVVIETGRFHQIRCQLSHHGMPLMGDAKYGTESSLYISRNYGIRTVALCANEISFIHPMTKKEMHFEVKPMNSAFTKM